MPVQPSDTTKPEGSAEEKIKKQVVFFGSARKTAEALAACELPSADKSIKKIMELTEGDGASMNTIAKIILKDPGLTTKVLRLANSVLYRKPGQKGVLTVTRALVLLGVNTLSSLCASAMVLSAGENEPGSLGRLRDALAISLHAATQARALALQLRYRQDAAEKAFIHALLSAIGEVAIWAHPGEKAEELEAALCAGVPEDVAQARVLGFSLLELGEALREHWGISCEPDIPTSLGCQIATVAPQGWSSSDMRKIVTSISALLKKDHTQVIRMLKDNADEAATTAMSQGLISVADRISPEVAKATVKLESSGQMEERGVLSGGDAAISVVSTLSDMLKLAKSSTNAPSLISLALEGMLRGANLDRAVFALLNKEGTRVSARLGLGECSEELFESLKLPVDDELRRVLGAPSSFLANTPTTLSPLLRSASCAKEYLVGPVRVRGKQVGFFYADNKTSERRIALENLQSFQLIAEQAELLMHQA
jgi:HD-like signal output (HDOD) protein